MSRKLDLDLQAKILLETIAIQKKREQIEAAIRALDTSNQHQMETEASREISHFYARHASNNNAVALLVSNSPSVDSSPSSAYKVRYSEMDSSVSPATRRSPVSVAI